MSINVNQLWKNIFYNFKNNLKIFKKINEKDLYIKDIYFSKSNKNSKKPEMPRYPDPEDCCNSGCMDCVYVMYDDLYQKYEDKLAKWELDNSDSNDSNY